MAVPAGGPPALVLSGDVTFLAGGVPVTDLTGTFVKSISTDGTMAVLQDADGNETDVTLASTSGGISNAAARALIESLVLSFARNSNISVPIEQIVDPVRYGGIIFDNRNPTVDDYTRRRIFFDGIEARKVRRVPTPGHDRIVTFREDNLQISQYGTGIYINRSAADAVPGTPTVGQRYFNRNQNHWEIWEAGNYWKHLTIYCRSTGCPREFMDR